jgi:hypothetical protein
MPKHYLNSRWTIWIHELTDNNWDIDSYTKVFDFNNIEDYWLFFKNYKNFTNKIYFIMRNEIKPVYEDKSNINGGEFSFIIPKKDVNECILELTQKMCGETLVTHKHYNINGIMISPKRNGLVNIKIWTKKYEHLKLNFNNPHFENYRYKKHNA